MPADTIHDLQHDHDSDPGPGPAAALKDAPAAPPPPPREAPGPHGFEHATPLAAPDQHGGATGRIALTGIAGVLVGLGAGFAVGRATAPRRRGLRLPIGLATVAPMLARSTYKTGKVAGKSSLTVGRSARRAQRKARTARRAVKQQRRG